VRINFKRWSVFNLVGFGGFLVQILTISALNRVAGWTPLVATAVALELAALVNFIGHSRWTWSDRPESSLRGWLCRFWRYQIAKTASLVANLVITSALSSAGVPVEIANTAAVLLCAVPNFLISERLVFSRAA
jgi:putative flippase GtrA